MKKILFISALCCCFTANAQQEGNKKSNAQKAVETTRKVNQKSQEINNASNEAAAQVEEAAGNVKSAVSNIKKILKVFEPVIQFHFKKRDRTETGIHPDDSSPVTNSGGTTENANPGNNRQPATGSDGYPGSNSYPGGSSAYQPDYGVPENDTYNPDGTMNMGHQNNGRYGNCLNLLEAKIMGMGEAEETPGKIDLVFFTQYNGLGYSFESPFDAPTINEGVSIKSWKERNETEIAESKLTIAQFEKITGSSSLVNAVKNARGYAASFYTADKMDGRVFAVKVQQDNKEVYALLAVYKQLGTAGSNGYLKIKIKVQGIDKNGDGYPDADAYTRQ